MKIETNEIEYCKVEVDYTANVDLVKTKRNDILKEFKNLPVSGFRKGKPTKFATLSKYKKQIEDKLQQSMVQIANDDIIFDTKMKTIGNPQVKSLVLEGNLFTCKFLYYKKPDFELQDYKSIEVPEPKIEKTVQGLSEEMIEQLRRDNSDSRPYEDEDFVQSGDKITLDITVSGEEKQEGILYDVKNKSEFGFDEQLFGLKPGEERDFKIKVGEEEKNVHVLLHMGMKQEPCPADDSLAEKLNIKSYNELIAQVQSVAQKQIENYRNTMIREQIKLKLIDMHDFEVPQWLSVQEAQLIAANEQVKWDELNDADRSSFLKRADQSVKMSFIIDSIQSSEPDVELSDLDVINGLKENLRSNGIQDVDKYIQSAYQNGRLFGLVAAYRSEFVIDWLTKQVKIVE